MRYGTALIVLLAGAACLRLAALDGAHGADRCAAPDALKATSLIPGSTALGERLEALDVATFQWSEGDVALPALAGLPVEFQIIRSYDAPFLYANPLHFAGPRARAARGGMADAVEPSPSRMRMQPEALGLREIDVDGARLPVHVAWDHTDLRVSRLVAWFFVFDDAPVRSPLMAQLRNAVGLALGGPRPLTLVTLSAMAPPPLNDRVEDAATEWLAGAYRYVEHSCEAR
jgi:hypothetical protein